MQTSASREQLPDNCHRQVQRQIWLNQAVPTQWRWSPAALVVQMVRLCKRLGPLLPPNPALHNLHLGSERFKWTSIGQLI